jgi:hypothetical protein
MTGITLSKELELLSVHGGLRLLSNAGISIFDEPNTSTTFSLCLPPRGPDLDGGGGRVASSPAGVST